ncbi:DUF397 domain-containing protein [Streptomyces fumanus]|uniref:DUF397 domain-containing protein n=1 Tax=Streptomyces fumanus TaxID=67302 RepID=UPI0033F5B7C8
MNRTPDLTSAVWRKSSYSDGGGTNCVEIASGCGDLVPVRDSKVLDGPVVVFGVSSWTAFLRGVSKGRTS